MRLAIDWDQTLVDTHTQEWLPGAEDALAVLLAAGHSIIVHTCRANWTEGLLQIEAKLGALALRVAVWDQPGKPDADLYIDNRGVHFDGDWDTILRHLRDDAPRPETRPTLSLVPGRRRTPPRRNAETWR